MTGLFEQLIAPIETVKPKGKPRTMTAERKKEMVKKILELAQKGDKK